MSPPFQLMWQRPVSEILCFLLRCLDVAEDTKIVSKLFPTPCTVLPHTDFVSLYRFFSPTIWQDTTFLINLPKYRLLLEYQRVFVIASLSIQVFFFLKYTHPWSFIEILCPVTLVGLHNIQTYGHTLSLSQIFG